MPIEHEPWIGDRYAEGIDGQRVAIVGYSHYADDGPDHPGLTIEVVNKVIDRTYRIALFSSIRNYFGFTDHAAFWHRVSFFNFVPSIVGTSEHRYRWATEEQNAAGRERAQRIMEAHRPQKLFHDQGTPWLAAPDLADGQGCVSQPQPRSRYR